MLHLQVLRDGFLGCIRDLKILTATTPEEVWTPVDWTQYVDRSSAMLYWEGCPFNLQRGVHFLGDGMLNFSTFLFPLHIQQNMGWLICCGLLCLRVVEPKTMCGFDFAERSVTVTSVTFSFSFCRLPDREAQSELQLPGPCVFLLPAVRFPHGVQDGSVVLHQRRERRALLRAADKRRDTCGDQCGGGKTRLPDRLQQRREKPMRRGVAHCTSRVQLQPSAAQDRRRRWMVREQRSATKSSLPSRRGHRDVWWN